MVRKLIESMNGSTLKIFRGVLIILIGATAIGVWNFNGDMSSMQTLLGESIREQRSFQDNIDERVHYLERNCCASNSHNPEPYR